MNSVETAQMFDEIEASLGRTMTPRGYVEIMTWTHLPVWSDHSGQTLFQTLGLGPIWCPDGRFHGEYDPLLTPTVADVAPLHGQFDLDSGPLGGLGQNMASFPMQDQQS